MFASGNECLEWKQTLWWKLPMIIASPGSDLAIDRLDKQAAP
jgi:hypothetical protein